MKKYLLILSICLTAIGARSQSMEEMLPKTATYYIKGGNQVPYNKIDSVINSWGGKFQMEHSGNTITLSPTTAADLKALEELKTRVNPMLNKPAPGFTLKDIEGKTYTLASLKGKVVVLNFWFTTCSGCIAEMPELNAVKQAYAGKNVVFLALGRDDVDRIKSFLNKHQFDYTPLALAAGVANDYGVSVYPTSMVIDKQGVIRFAAISGDNIKTALSSAIDSSL